MKGFVIVLVILNLIIFSGAGYRLFTSTQETEPFVDVMSIVPVGGDSEEDYTSAPPADEANIGETGTGGAVVEHLKGSRVDEINAQAEISTGSGGNTDYNAGASLERASKIEDGRQGDLDDAKKKIGSIGK